MPHEPSLQRSARRPFHLAASELPEVLPIFPLAGVLLMPHGRLPLNIFEPRYLAMVEAALGRKRLVGMVQPALGANRQMGGEQPELYAVGCAGRIHSFNETDDGRFVISLQGVCRFRIRGELAVTQGFRQAQVDWREFLADLEEPPPALGLARDALLATMQRYFKLQGVAGDWDVIEKTDDTKLITSLAMICPFQACEKQALLEAPTMLECGRLLQMLMSMSAPCGEGEDEPEVRH